MRSITAPGAPGRCPRCYLLLDFCLCALLGPAVPSQPRVVVVRHHWEAFKSTGTARLASLALSNLRILDFVAEQPELVRAELAKLSDAWLLYPDASALGAAPRKPPEVLVVLDGTWRQTRKMLRRLPELARMPRLSLRPDASGDARDRLREAPRAGARSTFESIAEALSELGAREQGERMIGIHQEFVARTRLARGQRSTL